MIPDKVWEILEEQEVVPQPTLPSVEKVVAKAREKHCSVQLNFPSDKDQDVLAIVSRHGSTFQCEQKKPVEALAIALADCLVNTEPTQTTFMDEETPKKKRTKKSGVVEQVAEFVDGLPVETEEAAETGDPLAPETIPDEESGGEVGEFIDDPDHDEDPR